TDVPYAVQTANGAELISLNQGVDAGQWRSAGTYDLEAGVNTLSLIAGAATDGTRVSADAIRWVGMFDGLTPGDADLDGDVDFTDAMVLVNASRSGTSTDKTWEDGDFDFSGTVDSADFAIFTANYQGVSNAP
ncbi:unnamed protein product, partial [Ectocarpus fasciculatus]